MNETPEARKWDGDVFGMMRWTEQFTTRAHFHFDAGALTIISREGERTPVPRGQYVVHAGDAYVCAEHPPVAPE